MGLFLDKTEVADCSTLIEAMPDKEFMNVTRSSLPLIAYWSGEDFAESMDYHFEYTVPSVPGARASHTDLMLIGADEVNAIEGKSTEPRYETVGEWSAKRGALRSEALRHWLALVKAVSGVEPNPDELDRCVYQMVHRLASVCSIGLPLRTLTYQVFDIGGNHEFYREDLSRLVDTFGLNGRVQVRLQRVETTLTPAGEELSAALPAMSPTERPSSVRHTLSSAGLFEFGLPETEFISRP